MKRKSIAASKKKLGRPRIVGGSGIGLQMNKECVTRRQELNLHHAFQAEMLMLRDPSLKPLEGHATVLAELGRMIDTVDDAEILQAAHDVLGKFNVNGEQKAAAAYLRAKRLGRPEPMCNLPERQARKMEAASEIDQHQPPLTGAEHAKAASEKAAGNGGAA